MAQHPRRFRPTVLPLEDRITPRVTNLMIDFSFDAGARPLTQGFNNRTFADAFTRGAPAFLDFDRSGVVDIADARIAANQVVQRVTDYFRPFQRFNVNVLGVELEDNQGAGRQEIARGKRSRRIQSFVMYVGGQTPDDGILGEANQAARGYNFEGHSQTYLDSIVSFIQDENPAATPLDFVKLTASTIAHEFGHALGLGHPAPDNSNPANVMDSSAIGDDAFLAGAYRAEIYLNPFATDVVIRKQNAFAELNRSFRGQPNENSPNLAFRQFGGERHSERAALVPPATHPLADAKPSLASASSAGSLFHPSGPFLTVTDG